MERIERLGNASPEELRQMKEKEYVPIGEAAAERYLQGRHGLRELGEALNRQRDGSDIIRRAALARLVEAITPEDCERPLEAIAFLAQDQEAVQEAAAKLRGISETCREAVQQGYQRQQADLERRLREELAALGIAGPAIELDVRATAEWHKLSQKLRAPYQAELDRIKNLFGQLAI